MHYAHRVSQKHASLYTDRIRGTTALYDSLHASDYHNIIIACIMHGIGHCAEKGCTILMFHTCPGRELDCFHLHAIGNGDGP